MPLEKHSQPIPVGGGVDQFVDEWLLQPPAAREAENLRAGTQGAYEKTTGFTTFGSASDVGDGPVVAPVGDGGVLVVGSRALALWEGVSSVASSNPTLVTTGVPVATRVRRRNLAFFKGRLGFPNLAYNQGYVGVVVNETFHDMPTGQSLEYTHVLVVDSDWNVIAHKQLSETLKECRIEGYWNSSSGRLGFVIFGTNTAGTTLKCDSVWKASSWAPKGPQSIRTGLWNTLADPTITNHFDTHWDGGAMIWDTVQVNVAGTCKLYLQKTTWDGTEGIPSVTEINTTLGPAAHCVFHDSPNARVNWFSMAASGTLRSTSENLAATTTPALVNVPSPDAWNGNCTVTGTRTLWARVGVCFFRDSDGYVRLQGNRITNLAGVTSVLADTNDYWVTQHRRPQPAATHSRFITVASRDESKTNLPVHYKRLPTLGDADVRVAYNDAREMFVVGLSSSQRARFYDGNGGNEYLCGQTAISARTGCLLVPVTVPEPNITPEEVGVALGTTSSTPWYAASESAPAFPFGINNGNEALCVQEIDLASSERSYVKLGDTTLVAAGALLACDGDITVPAWLDRPSAVFAAPQPGTLIEDWEASVAAPDHGRIWMNSSTTGRRGIAIVLVYTDKHGNQCRSEPFYTDTDRCCNTHSPNVTPSPFANGDWPHRLVDNYLPPCWFELFLPPPLVASAITADSLRVHVYLSDHYEESSDAPKEDWALSCVSPVIVSSGRYYFVVRDDLGPYISPADTTAAKQDDPASRPEPQMLYTITEAAAHRPPATNVICTAGNYAFLVPSENPSVFWASKPLMPGRLPEWNAELEFPAPPGAGDIISLAGMGDRLFLLCEHGTWELFVGSGGPSAAAEGDFGVPRRIYSRDGCLRHSTTASGDWGVFYVTASGPKFIDPSSEQKDIGRRILPELDLDDLTSVAYHEEKREIWLFGSTQGAWVYNLLSDAWTRLDFPADQAAEIGSGVMRFIATNAVLRTETTSPIDGTDNYVLARHVSPWLTVGDIDGFRRIWRVMVMPRKLEGTRGKLKVSLAYDFIDSDVDTSTWTWPELDALVRKPIIVRPSRQKCQAIRITVEDDYENLGSGDNPQLVNDVRYMLVGCGIEVATKPGFNKLPSGNKK